MSGRWNYDINADMRKPQKKMDEMAKKKRGRSV